MSYILLSDLGLGQTALRREATDDNKKSLTRQAISLNDQSQKLTGALLINLEPQIKATTAALDQFQAWENSSGWFGFGGWDSSQTVRANLQAATNNIRVRTGVRDGVVHGQQSDVSVLRETASNLPGEVKTQVNQVAECAGNPIQCWWDKTTKGQKAAMIAGGTVLIGAPVLFYFGGFIKAAGNLLEKKTR